MTRTIKNKTGAIAVKSLSKYFYDIDVYMKSYITLIREGFI